MSLCPDEEWADYQDTSLRVSSRGRVLNRRSRHYLKPVWAGLNDPAGRWLVRHKGRFYAVERMVHELYDIETGITWVPASPDDGPDARQVTVTDYNTGITYPSIKEAAEHTGFSREWVSKSLRFRKDTWC